jgi:hypothetical protein
MHTTSWPSLFAPNLASGYYGSKYILKHPEYSEIGKKRLLENYG